MPASSAPDRALRHKNKSKVRGFLLLGSYLYRTGEQVGQRAFASKDAAAQTHEQVHAVPMVCTCENTRSCLQRARMQRKATFSKRNPLQTIHHALLRRHEQADR